MKRTYSQIIELLCSPPHLMEDVQFAENPGSNTRVQMNWVARAAEILSPEDLMTVVTGKAILRMGKVKPEDLDEAIEKVSGRNEIARLVGRLTGLAKLVEKDDAPDHEVTQALVVGGPFDGITVPMVDGADVIILENKEHGKVEHIQCDFQIGDKLNRIITPKVGDHESRTDFVMQKLIDGYNPEEE